MRSARLPSRSSISGLTLASLLCLCALHANAQPNGSAQPPSGDESLLHACAQSLACSSHLNRANKLYEQNSYGAALDEYQAAYILQPYPLILYNIARIHHKQSHLAEAASYYQRYLDTGHLERAERARQLLGEAKSELAEKEQQKEQEDEPPPAPLRIDVSAQLLPQRVALLPSVPKETQPVRSPVYKTWWFWTLVGLTVAGVATTTGLVLATQSPDVTGLQAKTLSFPN